MTLKTYLARLAIDPDALSAFVSDPRRAAEEAGLCANDRSVLFSGDQNLIYAAVTKPETGNHE